MFIRNDKSSQVGYFIEPDLYTGSFIKSSKVKFQKLLRNFNGRTITLAFKNWPPFIWRNPDGTIDGSQYI